LPEIEWRRRRSFWLQNDIDKISGVLADTTARLNDLDSDLASTKQSMMQGNSQLEYLRSDADKLKLNAQGPML
jgi:hypothetical protein